jgi:hypothetical protein
MQGAKVAEIAFLGEGVFEVLVRIPRPGDKRSVPAIAWRRLTTPALASPWNPIQVSLICTKVKPIAVSLGSFTGLLLAIAPVQIGEGGVLFPTPARRPSRSSWNTARRPR